MTSMKWSAQAACLSVHFCGRTIFPCKVCCCLFSLTVFLSCELVDRLRDSFSASWYMGSIWDQCGFTLDTPVYAQALSAGVGVWDIGCADIVFTPATNYTSDKRLGESSTGTTSCCLLAEIVRGHLSAYGLVLCALSSIQWLTHSHNPSDIQRDAHAHFCIVSIKHTYIEWICIMVQGLHVFVIKFKNL